MGVYVTRFGITRRNSPSQSNANDWCIKNFKPMFPNNLSGFRIHAEHSLLFVSTITMLADNINLVIHNNWCRPAANILFHPHYIFKI